MSKVDAKTVKVHTVPGPPPTPTTPRETRVNGGKPGAIARMTECFEACRDANTKGYGSGVVIAVDSWKADHPKEEMTSCSPFTATICGMMFDRSGATSADVVYKPMYDDGTKPLPAHFYTVHQGNGPMGNVGGNASVVQYGLGYDIDPKDMRRGDLIGWDWGFEPPHPAAGHSAFCWDVHLNAKGEADCFLFLSSNGVKVLDPETKKFAGYSGNGVSIAQLDYDKWIVNDGTAAKPHWVKAKDKKKIFVDDPDFIGNGWWLSLPGYKRGGNIASGEGIDKETFKDPGPRAVFYANDAYWVVQIRATRFFGIGPPTREGADKGREKIFELARKLKVEDPPNSYATGKRSHPPDEKKTADTHFAPTPPNVVKKAASPAGSSGNATKSDPRAAPAASTKVAQRPDTLAPQQEWLRLWLQQLYRAQKIERDPGDWQGPRDDKKIFAAVWNFQEKFGAKYKLGPPDGIAGDHTKPAIQSEVKILHEPPPPPPLPAGTVRPHISHVYWLPNRVEPGKSAWLIALGDHLDLDQDFHVTLKDSTTGEEISLTTPLRTHADSGTLLVSLPQTFKAGTRVVAELEAPNTWAGTIKGSSDLPLTIGNPSPPPPTADGKYPTIAANEESENVRLLQFLLNENFPQAKRVTVTAKLDAKTIALMKAFQGAKGLAPTDTPDHDTWKALESASPSLPLLGKIKPWSLPLWTTWRLHPNYEAKEGDLWLRTLPQGEVKYDLISGLEGRKGTPLIYITKKGIDTDGAGSHVYVNSGTKDYDAQNSINLHWDDNSAINGDEIPYAALAGVFNHYFGATFGDVVLVIRNGKLAFSVYGDSGGGWPGNPADYPNKGRHVEGEFLTDQKGDFILDKNKNKIPRSDKTFLALRSGEGSNHLHTQLDPQNDPMRSEYIWIVFPGSGFANKQFKMSKDVTFDKIKERGKALLKLIGGNPDAAR